MIEISNLTKRYGANNAVDNLSFTVGQGEILGFLGPNGAGKTTTMNIITGYTSSTSGSVKVDGYDVLENPYAVKSRIGYLPEQPPLYTDMTPLEYLQFVYEIKKCKLDKKSHIDEVMDLVQISDMRKRLIKNLSKGYRQRVGLAQALIGNPKVLILDEPTVGLDPRQIIEIRNVIKDLGKNHTVILSSHILQEVSAICERVIIINKGKIVAIDTPENLSRSATGESKLVVRIEGDKSDVLDILGCVEGIAHFEVDGQHEPDTYDYIISANPDADIRKPLFYAMSQNNLPILMLHAVNLSLEDAFLQLISDQNDVSLQSPDGDEYNSQDQQDILESQDGQDTQGQQDFLDAQDAQDQTEEEEI